MKNKKIKKMVLILLVLVSLVMLAVIIQQTVWYLTEGNKKFDVANFLWYINETVNKGRSDPTSFKLIDNGHDTTTGIWDILWKPVAVARLEVIKTNTNFYIILMVISSAVFVVTTALSSYVIYELLKARRLDSQPSFKKDALGNNVL